MSAKKAEITGQPVVPTMDDAIITHTEYIDVNSIRIIDTEKWSTNKR